MRGTDYRSMRVSALLDWLMLTSFILSLLYLAHQLSDARRLQSEAEAELVLLRQKCGR
jgi:hypothetical protein